VFVSAALFQALPGGIHRERAAVVRVSWALNLNEATKLPAVASLRNPNWRHKSGFCFANRIWLNNKKPALLSGSGCILRSMAKTPSDKLYRLIRGLRPAEKRYFRLHVRAESKYLQLFEAMAGSSVFDEAAFIDAVYAGQRPESQKYSELKAYLYDLILRSLQDYDERQSADDRLNQLLCNLAVLFKRGYYDDCAEQIAKAARLARQYERFTQLLDLIRWERQLAYVRMDTDFLHRELDRLEQEELQILRRLEQVIAFRRAFFAMYAAVKIQAGGRDEDRIARLGALLKLELFESADKALSHTAAVLYYRTLNLYHYAAAQYDAFYDTGSDLLTLMESRPDFLKTTLSDYIAALSNFILSCGLLGRYDDVRAALSKLRQLRPNTEDDRRKIHRQYYANYFALCIYTGDFESGRAEMARCLEESARFDPEDYERASFFFQFSCICFGCGDFAGALQYLNQWLSQPRTVEREDLQSLARILSLLFHFELGNQMLLESLLRAATRFMQKKNRLFELERRFIQLFSTLMRAPSARAQLAAFQRIRADWPALTELPGASVLLQTFDLDAWVESKIQGMAFGEIVRRKFELADRLRPRSV